MMRSAMIGLGWALLFICGIPGSGWTQETATRADTFRVAYSSKVFYEVDLKDAQVAIDLWTSEISQQLGNPLMPSTEILSDLDQMVEAVQRKTVDMVAITSVDFLRVRDGIDLEPSIVGVTSDRTDEELVILVREGSGIESLEQLRGGRMLLPAGYASESVAMVWLETLLMKNDCYEVDSFFREMKQVSKPSQAVLPVFFGQAEAGLVSRRSFDVMTEMNPQLGNELRVVEQSPGFIKYMFCFRADYDPEMKQLIRDEAVRMGEYPKGRQILTLFKQDHVTEFEEEYLRNVVELLDEYVALKRKRR